MDVLKMIPSELAMTSDGRDRYQIPYGDESNTKNSSHVKLRFMYCPIRKGDDEIASMHGVVEEEHWSRAT